VGGGLTKVTAENIWNVPLVEHEKGGKKPRKIRKALTNHLEGGFEQGYPE